MNELVEYEPPTPVEVNARRRWVELMKPAADLAKSIAGTDFVKSSIRNNPAAIAACVLYGDEVGLGPMQALAQISVIDGRPALSAEAMRALILASGHELWVEESTVSKATIAGRRSGSQQVSRVTWTLDDARRANLGGKQNWRSYPRQMLAARATAELARLIFADAIGGLLIVEELEEGEAPKTERRKRSDPDSPQTRKRDETSLSRSSRPRSPSPGAEEGDDSPRSDLPPLPGEKGYERDAPATEAQRRKMHALFREAGHEDRNVRLDVASAILGRRIRSTSEMSGADVSHVIDSLSRRAESASTETETSAMDDTGDTPATSETRSQDVQEADASPISHSIVRARLSASGIDTSAISTVGSELFPGRSFSDLNTDELEKLVSEIEARYLPAKAEDSEADPFPEGY